MGNIYLAYDYPVLGAFWTLLLVFVWVAWLVLVCRVFIDIFSDKSSSGWAKAGWLTLVLVLPFVGVLAYLVVKGQDMTRRQARGFEDQRQLINAYVRGGAAGPTTDIGDLTRLAELKANGAISEDDFQRAKEKILR
jgi:Short C-terminal domain/Phospholipase_D-nuclease N-terminal